MGFISYFSTGHVDTVCDQQVQASLFFGSICNLRYSDRTIHQWCSRCFQRLYHQDEIINVSPATGQRVLVRHFVSVSQLQLVVHLQYASSQLNRS